MTERAWEKLEEERRRRTKEASDMLDQVLANDDTTEEELQAILAVLETIAQQHKDREEGRSHN